MGGLAGPAPPPAPPGRPRSLWLQALECIKLVSGVGDPLARRLMLFDGLTGRVTAVKLRAKSPACVACGDSPSVTRQGIASFDYVAFTGQVCEVVCGDGGGGEEGGRAGAQP